MRLGGGVGSLVGLVVGGAEAEAKLEADAEADADVEALALAEAELGAEAEVLALWLDVVLPELDAVVFVVEPASFVASPLHAERASSAADATATPLAVASRRSALRLQNGQTRSPDVSAVPRTCRRQRSQTQSSTMTGG
ncbi:MAG: hypothetical protein U0271_01875 [Polyangiaceae bacterium]